MEVVHLDADAMVSAGANWRDVAGASDTDARRSQLPIMMIIDSGFSPIARAHTALRTFFTVHAETNRRVKFRILSARPDE
jgi:hypothetical protein